MKTTVKAALAFAVMLFAWRMQAGTDSSAATIRSVSVLGAGSTLEVEVVASKPIQPQTQIITGPDRLILDFPNAVPDAKLRNVNVDKGQLKQVRVGKFSSNPPVTRVVLDLKSAQPYQLFPAGKTVIVKLVAAPVNQSQPGTPAAAAVPPPPPRKVEVSFSNGKLKIWADKATLAEVLTEVRHKTGAEVTFPPGSGQDPIVADLGPAPPREVLAGLLYGSQFNFVIIGADKDPSQLRGIFLTPRQGGSGDSGGMSYPAVQATQVRQVQEPAMSAPEADNPPPEAAPGNVEPDMAPNPPAEENAPPQ
ncbi:MAG TPA: AMIN domain-containing protein [Terriglobales bacterium]|nr:AMIN domain-containing protein [Terriglobales bacterium]